MKNEALIHIQSKSLPIRLENNLNPKLHTSSLTNLMAILSKCLSGDEVKF